MRKLFLLLSVLFVVSCSKDEITFSDDLLLNGSWSSYDMPLNWKYRDGSMLVNFKNKLFLMGGWTYDEPYNGGKIVNEIWVSNDGENWEQQPNAPWPGRHGAGSVVHNDKLFIVGGDHYNDCWSTKDGLNWVLENDNLPFEGRYTPNLVSINGNLVLYAGVKLDPITKSSIGFKDIWISKNGIEWKKLSDAPWEPRGLIHNSVLFNGKIYLIGGGHKYDDTLQEYSDVWTSKNGIDWEIETTNFGIKPRTHFSVLNAFDAIWISDGSIGNQSGLSNDLFFSRDGKEFKQVLVPSDMPKRHASSFINFKNKLIILGGPPSGFPRNKVSVYTLNVN